MQEWTFVSPELDSRGVFAALARLPNAADLKPVGSPAGTLESAQRNDQMQDANLSASLGITGVLSFAASLRTQVHMMDYMCFRDEVTETPHGGLINGTRWGAGFRLVVRVSRLEAEVKSALPAIAAQAELGLTDASFSITGYGLPDSSVMALLPPPGRFDSEACQQILDAGASLRKRYAKPEERKALVAKPIAVWLTRTIVPNPLVEAQALVYAMVQVAERRTLAEARKGKEPTWSEIVDRVYLKYADTGPGQSDARPSKAARDKAKAWLEVRKN